MLAERRRMFPHIRPEETVFKNTIGEPWKAAPNDYEDAVEELGLNYTPRRINDPLEHIDFLCLRHTFASWLLMAGTNLQTIMLLMGHQSINLTLRYARLNPTYTRQPVADLAGGFARRRHGACNRDILRVSLATTAPTPKVISVKPSLKHASTCLNKGYQLTMHTIQQQRERFRAGLHVDSSIVREMILTSWERSRLHRVNPYSPHRDPVDEPFLQRRLQENRELLESATVTMEKLFASISAAHSLIGLVDPHGLILHAVGRKEDLTRLHVFNRGFYATEAISGTNGLGTCLIEQRPIEIIGYEHYTNGTDQWSCAAAPIFDNNGVLAGVINVSIGMESYHHHTLGLVEATAHAISEQLHLRSLLKEQRIMLELIDEGVIILDSTGIISTLNTKAGVMLGLNTNIGQTNIRHLIKPNVLLDSAIFSRTRFQDQETVLQLTQGASIHCTLSSAPIPENNGIILTLRETKRMREYATRMLGARAEYTFEHIVGESATIREVIRLAHVATQSDITTLILGESGTGKELFAQAIHNASPRHKGPFVVVNCGALPRNLVESELFGYDEGAFTGANRLGKPGKFELADGGTIFLDEIGEMPLDAQTSLLRLLQEGELTRIGSTHSRRVNIRVIAATNKNLQEAVRQKMFRDDLFYRINVLTLYVPPLRERRVDIRLLAKLFLDKFAQSLGKSITSFTEEVLEALSFYDWPGNVRELENIIERTVNVSTLPVITLADLPAHIIQASVLLTPAVTSSHGILKNRELETILEVLQATGGNMRAAAYRLGIARSALYRKVKRLGVNPEVWRT